MDYDLIVERSRESLLQDWASNIHDEDVILLAAKYRPAQPQCIVEGVLGGSFNVCFKVAFPDEARWIVRVPKPGRSMYMDEKVRGEVTVMEYVKSHTSIPVPDIIAFGTAEDNVGGFGPFMITKFVDGEDLGAKFYDGNSDQHFEESIYRQIAVFLLELSNCGFDAIGSISMDVNGGEPSWSVRTGPLTLTMNEILRGGGVDLNGKSLTIAPFVQFAHLNNADQSGPYTSTAQYFLKTAQQKLDHLLRQQNSVDNTKDAIQKLKRRRLFQSITPNFVCSEFNHGHFALVCDDWRLGNMLVKGERIVAVLDWEWTYAGPLELLLSPPRWLCKGSPAVWDLDQRIEHGIKFNKFIRILEEEEMKTLKSGPPSMSNLMKDSWNRGKFEYHQLHGEVFLFDEDWFWDRIEVEHSSLIQNSVKDAIIINQKVADFSCYLAMSGPMRVFDFLRGSNQTKCSYCWACLRSDWMDHDIRDCVQVPHDHSTVSVMEAAAMCSSCFSYPKDLDVHVECGAPCYFGCTDQHCRYQMTAYSAYIAATGKASHLHQKALAAFAKHYNIDMGNITPRELITVMARPHRLASRTVSALVWFIELIHDHVGGSFQWYSQYGL